MAPPMPAQTLADILRDEGLTVVEVGTWRTHNRNHKGPWGPVHGVMVHHTVTSGTQRTVDICRTGYSGLPGPLCHVVVAKDGTVYLIGYGRTNHAGPGDGDVLRAVVAETPALPRDDDADTDGNPHFYGFECENLGDGKDPWPEAQLEAIERAAAAICRHHGWGPRSVIGHLEWQPGKVDPRGFAMDDMRDRIADRLAVDPEPEEPAETPPAQGGSYRVEKGDTLSAIGRELGVPWAGIAKANGITAPYRIVPGQELKIPGKAPAKPPAAPKPPAKPVVDLSRLVAAAKADPPKRGTPVSYYGVKTVETALVREGLLAPSLADGHFGTATRTAYASWQRRCGYSGKDADGIPGATSLKKLAARRGFTVTN
ncbi:LysM peptidoglycan-binding domain-containing protein [Streptomyces sp. PKU-MA01144]|uniref:N-acetylmuramoyl-L-alanine amidase n=1 Tax=Streptomyces sp. PKU-MA01144 TaxID=2729138 RepID=UPI001479F98E|nr:N-acetylmuramoyl-L-alanine amidase [Streptomyces sp. PKU-MA01144]NNJ04140.1 LysM peptidoglycan-binding domain-containing protein [Streptomyces sp. PKU-MA01144]